MNLKTLLFCLLCLSGEFLWANEYVYVSSKGNDAGDGSVRSPYYSLNKAIEGRLSGKNTSDTLFVIVEAGDYWMDRPVLIDRSEMRPLVIKSADKAKPHFYGGIRVSGWQKYKDGIYRTFISEVLRSHLNFEQLYVNGQRATLARTPNADWFYVRGSAETVLEKNDFAVQRIDMYPSDFKSLRGLTMKDLAQLKLRFFHKWDITQKKANFVNIDSACFYISGQPMPRDCKIEKDSRCILYDYAAALDSVSEWYLDRNSGYLYYMPRRGEQMETVRAVVPTLKHWIVCQGTYDQPVKNVLLENLAFEYSSYLLPEKGEEPRQGGSFSDAAMLFDFAENISIVNCDLLHTGEGGIWFREECHHNTVKHCYLYDLGAGGIKIGDRFMHEASRKVSSDHLIDNCIISHGGFEMPTGVGVLLMHTCDNRVTHNEISDFRYSGVSVGWLWGYNQKTSSMYDNIGRSMKVVTSSPAVNNLISFNHIHHIGWGELSDMGGIYTLGESQGTKVTDNVVHDIWSYGYGGWGLYNDEGSTDIWMTRNLVYRCKTGGYQEHYGKENHIENNIFGFGAFNQIRFTRAEPHVSFIFKHNIVIYDSGEMLGGAVDWKKANVLMDNNLYWKTNGRPTFLNMSFEEWRKFKEPHSVCMNPMFKDAKNDDYTFTSFKAARKIDFHPFDSSQAGVYGSKEWKEKAILSPETLSAFQRAMQKWRSLK